MQHATQIAELVQSLAYAGLGLLLVGVYLNLYCGVNLWQALRDWLRGQAQSARELRQIRAMWGSD